MISRAPILYHNEPTWDLLVVARIGYRRVGTAMIPSRLTVGQILETQRRRGSAQLPAAIGATHGPSGRSSGRFQLVGSSFQRASCRGDLPGKV
jgi:hypothetical protein